MSDISYYTEEGYKALKDEVHHLISVERPKISAQIGEAIDKGDLSENAEYDAAKDAQGHLEGKPYLLTLELSMIAKSTTVKFLF